MLKYTWNINRDSEGIFINKKLISKFLALSIFATTCISSTVSVAAAEQSKMVCESGSIESRQTIYDVIRSYSSYQGKTVSVEEVRRQDNGDRYYYRGNVEYIGRDGLFGDYKYLGDLRRFTLYKIITSDGSVIYPSRISTY